ncbi:MAG: hypothetical protein M3228_15375 [Actinomycetota bacterium]|nr:hypothetical protein [Actinomycetota bacterium]
MVPMPLTVVIIAGTLGLVGLLIAGIAYASVAARGSTPGIRQAWIMGVSATILLGWIGILFVLGPRGAFAATPDTSNPAIAFGIGIPIILGLCCFAASGRVRTLVTAIPLHWLIAVQLYRVLGVSFLVAYLWQIMPAEFAVHAGIGDTLVGLTAPLAAYAVMKKVRSARVLARSWNVLGIAELVLAVTLGFLTSPTALQQLALSMPNSLITRYPFVLFPTFVVPVSILLHAAALWRLRSAAITAVDEDSRRARLSTAGG